MQQQSFLKNLFFLLILNVLIKPFYLLGIDVSVQNQVGTEAYGVYFALLNFSFLFNIVLDLGINNYNNRMVAGTPSLLTERFSVIIPAKFGLSIMYFAVSLLIASVLGFGNMEIEMLLWLLFNQLLVSFILYFRSNLSALHLFKTDSVVSVLDRMLLIIIMSVLLWGNLGDYTLKIEHFIYAQTIAYAFTLSIAYALNKPHLSRFRFSFKFSQVKSLFSKSIPYAFLILLMMLYTRLDGVMIERIHPDGGLEAGIYAQGFRIMDAFNMVAFLFAGILLPVFSRLLAEGKDYTPIMLTAFRLLFSFVTLIGVAAYLYSDELLRFFYTSNYPHASEVFIYLMATLSAFATTYIFGTLLTANGSLKQLNRIALVGLAVNFTLNLVLIPEYGATGAAIATLVTQGITALAQLLLCQIMFNWKPNFPFIRKFVLFLGGLVGMVVLIRFLKLDFPVGISLLVVGIIAWSFLTRWVTIAMAVNLLKKSAK